MGEKRFCVISQRATNRTWFGDRQAAEFHARQLLQENIQKGSSKRTLLVVETISAVAIEPLPIVTRPCRPSDFQKEESNGS